MLLPGVGAFDRTMSTFRASGMANAVRMRLEDRSVACLGICVGMHVLANSSEEGSLEGMGLVPGQVRRFHPEDIPESPKVPHLGWNTIEVHKPHPLLAGIAMAQGLYFLTSYPYQCDSADDGIATARHGRNYAGLMGTARVFGAQCPPKNTQT